MKRLAILAAGLILSAVCVAAPRMTPGLWEMTVNVEEAGMPPGMIPPTTYRHCYRPEDVKDLRATVPKKNPNCRTSDWKESGNTVTWTMSCEGRGTMTGSGKITYTGDRYRGENKIVMVHDGRKTLMTQSYSARRVGDCR
ncbi:MAG: DUF3617 domain-containing protein [Sulfuricaulis sp.]